MKIAVVGMRNGGGALGLSAEFGPAGGTIGRAPTNLLVLDDPDRTVSRIQAQVLCRDGAFYIIDQGSNPLQCNGVVLGAGNEKQLSEGDRLQIGGFELAVSQVGGASPKADILGDFTFTSGIAAQPPAGAAASFSSSAVSADDPFADLLAGLTPAAAPVAAPAARASNAPAAPSFFPDPMGLDKPASPVGKADPFDDLLNFGGSPSPSANPLDNLGIMPSAGSSSIDDLFDLSMVKAGNDPFAASPLGAPMMQPNTASSADPFEALLGGPKATAASHSDHVPVLQQAYALPKAVDAKPVVPQPAPVMAPVAPPVAAPLAPPAPPPVAAFIPPPPPPVVARPAPTPVAPPVAAPRAASAAGQASDSELMAAFLRGVKTTQHMPTELTPALMELIGGMLHSATHGTLQLLISRQEFKRGVRSDVTMISVEANNPLKFSPTVEVALAHMLGPRIKGFMGAEDAMQNAYADLRAHQMAVMVGIRAALAHVLERFTPEKLEARLTEKSALDALFAANRKAKLWDQFCQLYSSIAAEAEDDFHTLFGQAFTKAYDEQMARFKTGR
jgi:type VI secretion system FHA domain protein